MNFYHSDNHASIGKDFVGVYVNTDGKGCPVYSVRKSPNNTTVVCGMITVLYIDQPIFSKEHVAGCVKLGMWEKVTLAELYDRYEHRRFCEKIENHP